MCVRSKIIRVNNKNLAATDAVGPVNSFPHSLFSQVEVSLNGTLITTSTSAKAYRAYIETLSNNGIKAQSSQMASALFYKDEAGKMDRSNPLLTNAANRRSGVAERQTFGAESRDMNMTRRIHTDIVYEESSKFN
jgi:hypothetical protein